METEHSLGSLLIPVPLRSKTSAFTRALSRLYAACYGLSEGRSAMRTSARCSRGHQGSRCGGVLVLPSRTSQRVVFGRCLSG